MLIVGPPEVEKAAVLEVSGLNYKELEVWSKAGGIEYDFANGDDKCGTCYR